MNCTIEGVSKASIENKSFRLESSGNNFDSLKAKIDIFDLRLNPIQKHLSKFVQVYKM